MTARETYSLYLADDTLSSLSDNLIDEILSYNPLHTLDFGSGSGKHSNILNLRGIVTLALDISMMNIVRSHSKYDLPFVACCDETYLGHVRYVDVVFTCSVLDHIKEIDTIIEHFKRIANKAVILAETNDKPSEFYFSHDYESYGFVKTDYSYVSEPPNGDGATYSIWKWEKRVQVDEANDDLGISLCVG